MDFHVLVTGRLLIGEIYRFIQEKMELLFVLS
jgi:hypothetical protein